MANPDYKSDDSDSSDGSDSIPTECPICDKQFKDPIVTQCGHFFCEKCALIHDSESKKCYECEKRTNGVFNNAIQVLAKMKKEKLKNVNLFPFLTEYVDYQVCLSPSFQYISIEWS